MFHRPLFVLAPPRSFSSIVTAMLGQHPQAYGFPELNLFLMDTVRETLRAYERGGDQARHGLLRVVAQLHDGEQTVEGVERARQWLEGHAHWSTKTMHEYLLDAVAPRLGIEKSPRTVMHPEHMKRLMRYFPDARFLHLVRHPRTNAESQIRITSRNDEWGGRLDASSIQPDRWWEVGEKIILNGLREIPPSRVMRVRGEDLLSDPRLYLVQITEWLELDSGPDAIDAMLHPERSPYACLGPENARYGNDINYLENPELRVGCVPNASLDGPVSWAPTRGLSLETKQIARLFGYR